MKKYQIIYADPPWAYKVWSEAGKLAQFRAENHYKTMDISEICNLDIRSIADKDCKLFLWVTPPFLEQSFEVIKSWGFIYRTLAFTWVKTNKKTFAPFFGGGHWTASNAELCLGCLIKGGKLNRRTKSISQVILSPREEHSQKPYEVREKIVELCGDLPRIELFARQKVEGWDCWGNEVKSDIEL